MKGILLEKAQPSDFLRSNYDVDLIRYIAKRRDCSDLRAFMEMTRSSPFEASRLRRIAGGAGTMSNYLETHLLDHANGKTSFTMPAVVAVTLCTVVPDSSKTGATITEAGYTGFNRVTVAGTGWNASSAGGAGAASTSSNNGTITFPNCTAGSSVVIAWAICDNATVGAGNMLWWGTCSSTTISTTQTPPTIANAGITQSLI